MIHIESIPEKCIGCKSMQNWIYHPNDSSPTPVGDRPNSEFYEQAKRMCPGVQINLSTDLNPSEIVQSDTSYVIPLSGLEFYCGYYERAFGDKR